MDLEPTASIAALLFQGKEVPFELKLIFLGISKLILLWLVIFNPNRREWKEMKLPPILCITQIVSKWFPTNTLKFQPSHMNWFINWQLEYHYLFQNLTSILNCVANQDMLPNLFSPTNWWVIPIWCYMWPGTTKYRMPLPLHIWGLVPKLVIRPTFQSGNKLNSTKIIY